MLKIFPHVCALMTLAFLLDAVCSAAMANPDGSGPPDTQVPGHDHQQQVA
jgi:hypothetical protein